MVKQAKPGGLRHGGEFRSHKGGGVPPTHKFGIGLLGKGGVVKKQGRVLGKFDQGFVGSCAVFVVCGVNHAGVSVRAPNTETHGGLRVVQELKFHLASLNKNPLYPINFMKVQIGQRRQVLKFQGKEGEGEKTRKKFSKAHATFGQSVDVNFGVLAEERRELGEPHDVVVVHVREQNVKNPVAPGNGRVAIFGNSAAAVTDDAARVGSNGLDFNTGCLASVTHVGCARSGNRAANAPKRGELLPRTLSGLRPVVLVFCKPSGSSHLFPPGASRLPSSKGYRRFLFQLSDNPCPVRSRVGKKLLDLADLWRLCRSVEVPNHVPPTGVFWPMQNENVSLRRLEESRWQVEAGGLRNLPWKPDVDNPLAPPVLDIDWLVAQPLLPFLVEVVPASVLYRSLMAHGLEDSLEVLEWLQGEQLQRVLDFDIWSESSALQSEDISASRVVEWFRAWLEIGPEFAAERLFELDEETIVCAVTSLFEILPEGLGGTADEMSDDYVLTPDRKFHVKMRIQGEEEFEIAQQVVRALYGRDVRLASRVFAYSAMLVRQESLEDALRWRRGRLADQGFVDVQEARASLRLRSENALCDAIRAHVKREQAKVLDEEQRKLKFAKTEVAFMADIEPEMFDAVATRFRAMEPELGYRYISNLLEKGEIRRIVGSSAEDAESIMADDDIVKEATERAILQSRAMLSRVYGMSSARSEQKRLLVERAIEVFPEATEGDLLDLKSRMARVSNTLSAALAPSDFLSGDVFHRALGIARGAINVGLEKVVQAPAEYGVELDPTEFEEVRAAWVLKSVGPEHLFQLGWQSIARLPVLMAEGFVALEKAQPRVFAFLGTRRQVRTSDSGVVEVSVDALVQAGRYVDVRKWIEGLEALLPAPAFWVASAILNRAPMFPEAFESPTRSLRPFSTMAEVVMVERFVAFLEQNLTDARSRDSEALRKNYPSEEETSPVG